MWLSIGNTNICCSLDLPMAADDRTFQKMTLFFKTKADRDSVISNCPGPCIFKPWSNAGVKLMKCLLHLVVALAASEWPLGRFWQHFIKSIIMWVLLAHFSCSLGSNFHCSFCCAFWLSPVNIHWNLLPELHLAFMQSKASQSIWSHLRSRPSGGMSRTLFSCMLTISEF